MRTFLIFCSLLVVATGCSLIEIQNQAEIIENAGVVKGNVKLTGSQTGHVIVSRYQMKNGAYVFESYVRATPKGDYTFNLSPGTYYIGAFIDVNNDGDYQSDVEDGNYYSLESGKPAGIVVRPGETVINKNFIIYGKPPALVTKAETKRALSKAIENIGVIISLDDPVFTKENNAMGMWTPVQFLQQVDGGLFFLQKYQQDKIPILFIHGMGGSPVDWKRAIEKIDKRYFQPWVICYPTGLRLEMVSQYLVNSISYLQGLYKFKKIFIAAHSMGGLVAHSFIEKYLSTFPDYAENIDLVITVNSPLNGMQSALSGVNNSPIVLPAWRDIATGSEFIKGLNDWWWPEEIPYHLIFSYQTGNSGDGVVSLESQIPMRLQTETTRLYGFNNNHVGTLNDDAFLSLFNSILLQSID